MKALLLSSVLLIMMTACAGLVQDIDPGRLPKTDPQLVVHCYLSPQDTVLWAGVSMSRTNVEIQVDSTAIRPVPNAHVTLSEGNNSVVLRLNPREAMYGIESQQFVIKAGHTYTLTVELPDGQRATARTTVPGPAPTPEVRIDSVVNRATLGGMDYSVQLRWQDIAGEVNYYDVSGDNEYTSTYLSYSSRIPVDLPFQAINRISFLGSDESSLLTDTNRDGQSISSPRAKLQVYGPGRIPVFFPPHTLNVYLLNVNQAYYDYHQMVLRQTINDNNPFAEPTTIQGNIQGALGCFGAYNRATAHFRLK